MSHVDPLLAVPIGGFFAVVSAWIALAPEQFPRTPGRVRLLDRLLGEAATTLVLRLGGVILSAGSVWLVYHAIAPLLGVL